MTIAISVPDEWVPGQAVAVRALPQRAVHGGHPLITAIRADAIPGQLRETSGRAGALVREAGQAA
jgi:hypothetical protein